MTTSIPADANGAAQIAQALNTFIGLLYAARVSATIWLRHVECHPIAAAYHFHMTGETIFLTLRKFDDLWCYHIKSLLPETAEGRQKGEWIINEIQNRHLRTTANK